MSHPTSKVTTKPMVSVESQPEPASRFPHRVAVLLVCATFPLIWIGGLVTTYDAGMAVPDWPTTYGYNLFLYPLSTWLSGPWDLLIEHGHRLLASCVGLITIGFVVAVWRYDGRSWMKWYSVGCLALVIIQGVLGGLRVVLDETALARIHGCVGPLFFASCVAAAAFTSSWWSGVPIRAATAGSLKLQRTAWTATALIYSQLVLGAHLRHLNPTWSPQLFQVFVFGHLMVAAVLLTHLLWFAWQCRSRPDRRIHRPVGWLLAAVLVQLTIGAGAWRVKYYWPTWLPGLLEGYAIPAESMTQTMTVTAHVAMGSLLLALSVMISLRCSRLLGKTHSTHLAPTKRLGVAL